MGVKVARVSSLDDTGHTRLYTYNGNEAECQKWFDECASKSVDYVRVVEVKDEMCQGALAGPG